LFLIVILKTLTLQKVV